MALLQKELFRIIVGNSAAWFVIIFIPGTIIQRLPLRLYRENAFLFRICPWEREGRIYRSLGIKWWKELLSDGAGIFQDGFRKKKDARDGPALPEALHSRDVPG
ncbi:MAG: hypothetical protein SVR04_10130 [Spirochaetota bacterium]|nr:hypothetical protein [Spirochaetota bacterium]